MIDLLRRRCDRSYRRRGEPWRPCTWTCTPADGSTSRSPVVTAAGCSPATTTAAPASRPTQPGHIRRRRPAAACPPQDCATSRALNPRSG